MSKKQNADGFFKGFLLGALIGAGVVYFSATEEGKKNKEKIKKKGLEILKDLDKIADDLEDKGTNWVKKVEDFSHQAKDKAELYSDKTKEKIAQSLDNIGIIQQRGRQLADEARRYFTKDGRSLGKR